MITYRKGFNLPTSFPATRISHCDAGVKIARLSRLRGGGGEGCGSGRYSLVKGHISRGKENERKRKNNLMSVFETPSNSLFIVISMECSTRGFQRVSI